MPASPGRARLRTLPLLAAGLLAGTFQVAETEPPLGRDVTVHVEAGDYAFSPAMIELEAGDRVTLVLNSTDYVHGLYLEGYDLDVVADPGEPAALTFVADRPGSFRFRCSVACGSLHPFMTGRLRVGPDRLPAALLIAGAAVVIGGVAIRRRPGSPS